MGPPDMAMATLGPAPPLAIACSDTVDAVYTLPTSLPTMDDTHRGDVFHCAVTESLTAAKANAQLNDFNKGYANAVAGNVTSGFWTYRIAFRSTRNTVNGARAEGDMAAVLLVPEHPLTGAPLVVFDHGSVGVASKCAPSRLDLSAPSTDQDFPVNMMRMAGYGYTVIAPDYAGFSYNQAPVGYFNAEDEAHGILDATRAAANVLPSPPGKVVFVGHSQGGHAALAAQHYIKSYGMKGTLAGVAVFAPLWTSMSLWAAATTPPPAAGLKTATDSTGILYSMEYNYAAGELRSPGHGKDVFQAAKAAGAVDAMYGGECYDSAKLQALGAQPSDFFDASFVNNTGFNCAASPLNADCTMAPSPTWMTRWQEDRPALDAQSAPIVIFYGGMDTTVKPGWAACSLNKLNKDVMGGTTMLKVCYDANAQHRDIIRGSDGDFVNQWIAARAGLGSDPTPDCMPFPSSTTCAQPFNDY